MAADIEQQLVALLQEGLRLQQAGRYGQAITLVQQASDLAERHLGRQHPLTAASLNNLAELYRAQGHYAEAEPHYQRALAILEQAIGPDHPAVATSLNNLAALYGAQGRFTEAEPRYQRALAIREQALGPDHPDVATSLNNLATLLAATGRYSDALANMERANRLNDHMIGQLFTALSESQRAAYLDTFRGNFNAYLSLVARHRATDPAAVTAAFELVLRRKALGAEALAVQRDAILGGRYPHLKPQLDDLTQLRRQIAQRTLAGPGQPGQPVSAAEQTAHQQQLAAWNAQRERLEADLARQIPEMNLAQRLQAADRKAVASALPKDAALIEFVRFNVYDFQAIPAKDERQWQPPHYLAFVLPAGQPDQVAMIDLGEAVFIDQRLARFRAAITGENEPPRAAAPAQRDPRSGFWARLFGRRAAPAPQRDLGAPPPEIPLIAGDADGHALRQALFDPLRPALGPRQQLFLSPDGDLSRLPFDVLPTGAPGQRLIDAYHLSYLSSGRDLLRFGAPPSGQPAPPLIAADPDFDLGGRGQRPAATGRRSRDLDRANLRFSRLPGTRIEGEHLARMLNVQPWLEDAALEARLKAQRSPRLLHLATHGFFLEDQPYDPEQTRRLDFTGRDLTRLGSRLENPLLRSGLALAGVNTWLTGHSPPPEAEDGLLTAEDVTGLDLLDTELVVLSACETGLGDVHIGEGVQGLRRAFVLAGARTLVMSLWKVPDQQTQALMEDLYTRLRQGQRRADALRAAQQSLRARYPEPFYWGAFICQGEIGPLRQP